MSSSSEIVDSGRSSGQKTPEKSSFSQTCSLLSQYLKEKGSLGDLSLGIGFESNGTTPQIPAAAATMNLFPATEKPGQGIPAKKQPENAQMTIFYGGQVVVFNDLPSEKAKEIMMLASKACSSIKQPEIPASPKVVVANSVVKPHRPQPIVSGMDHFNDDLLDTLPGPSRANIIWDNRYHVSEDVWDGSGREELECICGNRAMREWKLRRPQRELLHMMGFGIFTNPHVVLGNDARLISTLIERWRPETNTFFMRQGEMTVTLEDVGYILGLPVVGEAVTCGLVGNRKDFFIRNWFEPLTDEEVEDAQTA